MIDEHGQPFANRVLEPQKIYQVCRNVPPDLMVYFDGLSRRSIGTVGHGDILRPRLTARGWTTQITILKGSSSWHGCPTFRSGTRKAARIEKVSCLDITPTILREFELPVPTDLLGKPIIIGTSGDTSQLGVGGSIRPCLRETAQPSEKCGAVGFTPEEEEMVKKRLMELGYV